MRFIGRRTSRLLVLLLAFTLVGAACGSDGDQAAAPTSANPSAPGGGGGTDNLSGTIEGTGASFPDAFYQTAIEEFASTAPDLTVNYNAVGSGQGKKDFAANLNDFAGSDSLVKPDEGVDPSSFFYIPTVAAPITLSYNLPKVDKLQLSGDTLAKIFQRQIKTWNDPAIAADNPDADLPGTDIVVAHRADGSGTTNNFTKYLDKASEAWTLGSGDTVAWPADTQAGQKNTGVAQIISSSEGAIGYVDLADARATKLTFASIKNKSGNYVEPTLEATSGALAGAEISEDLSYDPLNADGTDAYPITAPTYILVHTSYDDPTVAANVKAFVTYLLSDAQDLAESVDFAKLPDELRTRALAQLDKVQGA